MREYAVRKNNSYEKQEALQRWLHRLGGVVISCFPDADFKVYRCPGSGTLSFRDGSTYMLLTVDAEGCLDCDMGDSSFDDSTAGFDYACERYGEMMGEIHRRYYDGHDYGEYEKTFSLNLSQNAYGGGMRLPRGIIKILKLIGWVITIALGVAIRVWLN